MTAPIINSTEDVAISLTIAVVAYSHFPLLLLDEGLNIVVASGSFCKAFNIDPTKIVGQSVLGLGRGEWNVPQLRALLVATAAGEATLDGYEFDLRRLGAVRRRLAIHAQRLTYLDLDHPRLLVAVVDVTEARESEEAKKSLTDRNEILVREVRHRVANSLQLIAAVLLQGARRAESEETRSELKSAHSRVMSVAALERELSASSGDKVGIRTYLSRLCAIIEDSMIDDDRRISIKVVADNTSVPAKTLVGLGLIMTELVINALKHAFPDGRTGTVRVTYASRNHAWSLGVSDDGVGLPPNPAEGAPGLGTSIVQALAHQLNASIQMVDSGPGVSIFVAHAMGPGEG